MKISCERTRWVGSGVLALSSLLLLAPPSWAQQASGIAGAVRDGSGAVMPGVTVEASSPALIEKVRTVVTDGEGRYNVVDLRPGAYVVTFTLAGFNTIRREGIVLTAGFTATVNADMQVGALEETITVTGASPLVDTASVRQQKVVSAELLATLPTSSKALSNLITLVAGMTGSADVGGSSGIYRSNAPRLNLFHGKAGIKVLYDGLSTLAPSGAGALAYVVNPTTAEETAVETGGVSAESSASGVLMNMIPKEGGNTIAFAASGTYTNDHLQRDNLTDALRARGLTTTNKVLHLYDGNVSLGGPIRKDRLWFFTATRTSGNRNQVAGVFFTKNQGTIGPYVPDLTRPSYRQEWLRSLGGRVTWQVSQRNKVNAFADVQSFYNRGRGEFAAPEATSNAYNLSPQGLFQITWNSPTTSKLLLEAGASYMKGKWPFPSPGDGFMRVSPNDISILELSTNFRYNALANYSNTTDENRGSQRFSMSYVTGSHAVKGGVQVEEAFQDIDTIVHGDVNYTFLNGLPNSITQYASPYLRKDRVRADLGLFVQDRWTRNRLTLNYGLRFDYLNGGVPAQQVPATRFVPVDRDFAAVHDVPAWKDLNPRLGASYDLLGNGRTALKVSLGRYVEVMSAGIASANNPITTSVNTVTRTWNDANGNYIPDCNLNSPAANGECGAFNNVNFGKNNPAATRYADEVLRGFGARGIVWDLGTEVQHQLRPGMSITGGYYRNWANNFRVTDNLAVTPADYSPYCITAPVDARLPGGGGYQICGLYDVAPARFGQVNNLVTRASNYYDKSASVNCGYSGALAGQGTKTTGAGTNCGTSDFFGVSVNTRVGSGILLGGGLDTGRTVVDNCFVIDSPQQLLNCRVVTPFKAQTQVKLFGTYPLPGNFAVSGTFQNVSGVSFEADYAAPNPMIAPILGRNLAACGTRVVCTATATVPLVAPQTQFEPRRTQLDVRVTKVLRLGSKARLQANVDLYNALNGSAVLGDNSTYGPTWRQPIGTATSGSVDAILPGRLIQFGGQLTF